MRLLLISDTPDMLGIRHTVTFVHSENITGSQIFLKHYAH
ncbi:hypothetical protein D1BOALGB6SA_6652 [Olavius sp. associated proteobacterium Delta 1]|nr:hypothetical protein D1BOALGB6SA_6652 [Olavius sp. associated proteobacterium Delta 1]